jgi:DNA polymerase I-like protein with 3'-5' exonuclease and polymerase domains
MTTWSVDCEYGFRGPDGCPSGFVPVVFCAAGVTTPERYAFDGRDPRLAQWVNDHRGDLFVSHNLVAEAQYLLRLGIAPPARWFDTMLAWRYTTNTQSPVPPYSLEAALTGVGIPHRFAGEKTALQKWIGELRFDPDSPDDRRGSVAYCQEDVRTTAALYRHLAGLVPAVWMNYAVEYALAVARMCLRGLALDRDRYALLQERKGEVIEAVVAEVNAAYPVFIDGRLSRDRFFQWCIDNGVSWPLTYDRETGRKRLALDKRSFESMKERHPFIKAVHEAKKVLVQLNDRDLPVDPRDGRHYPGMIPCAQSTGRSSAKNSIFGGPKCLRWLVVPSDGGVLVVVDMVAEESGIAAHQSSDGGMTSDYMTRDVHMAAAIRAGAAPEGARKEDGEEMEAVRKVYKVCNLGTLYGQTPYGMAAQAGIHPAKADRVLRQHKRMFPDFWAWADAYTTRAFADGICYTAGGWPRKVGRMDRPRSVVNFPIQGAGADLLRLATVYLTRLGAPLLTTVHDSFIFEVPTERLSWLHEVVDYCLGRAVNQLLPGSPLRWKWEEYGECYKDGDGKKHWELVDSVLSTPKGVGLGVG